ncbi:hypothetical protein [Chryseobacterium sp. FH1]|uniref:hypothetical protein n=1 Tax=Chryseobacterium sp. FH1 TaxID=1233951 RepID=UPI0004E2BABB|nr:hypothetical protein [Chryseobacterium sp. FH1]KFC19653.1 hypothetical protein IO90_10290 [Chryseobacterium sp. FH1]
MKNSDNLSKLSNDELLRTLKRAKTHFIGFMIFFALLVIGCNYFTFTIGPGYYTLIPMAFIPIIIAHIFNYGKIKQEVTMRRLH